MIHPSRLTKINSENILFKKKKIQHFQLRKVTADPPLRKPRYPPTDYKWCNSDCVWEAENICLLAQGGYFKAVTAILSITLISWEKSSSPVKLPHFHAHLPPMPTKSALRYISDKTYNLIQGKAYWLLLNFPLKKKNNPAALEQVTAVCVCWIS